jgi:glycyl-tRNA synthetase
MRRFDVPEEERAHYSAGTIDVEYRFGFQGSEWGELMGIANRTDFDLSSHSKASGTELSYFDQASGERFTPFVIEPSFGLTRSMMAFLVDAYSEDEAPNSKGGVDTRTVLRLDPRLAPVKAAVLPLSRNEQLSPLAKELAADLRKSWNIDFDDAGAIGRRYRRQDEIGTPFCITVDFDTLDDKAVTVRERDSMKQERVSLDRIRGYIAERLLGA